MSRRFVSEHAVRIRCAALRSRRVPRSSYYEWVGRPLPEHYLDDVDLANEIYDIHVVSRRTYGAPRLPASCITAAGIRPERMARIMSECGLVGVHGRRKWWRGREETAPGRSLAPLLHRRAF